MRRETSGNVWRSPSWGLSGRVSPRPGRTPPKPGSTASFRTSGVIFQFVSAAPALLANFGNTTSAAAGANHSARNAVGQVTSGLLWQNKSAHLETFVGSAVKPLSFHHIFPKRFCGPLHSVWIPLVSQQHAYLLLDCFIHNVWVWNQAGCGTGNPSLLRPSALLKWSCYIWHGALKWIDFVV